MSSQTECHLDKLPVELLQYIIDYEPELASCSRKLLVLGYKHRYKAIQGPKPSWTILGKRLNRRSIRRFFDYLDEILSDKSKASCITSLNLNLQYTRNSSSTQHTLDRTALMASRIPKLETFKVTIPSENYLRKLPRLKRVKNVAVTITQCTRYNYIGNLLREKFPNAQVIYIDAQPVKYKTSSEWQNQILLEWAAELLVICQYLRFPHLKRLSIFGRVKKYEFFEAYSYFRKGEQRVHQPLDFEFGVMSTQTVLTVLRVFAEELRQRDGE